MNNLSNLFINKLPVVNALVVLAILFFAVQMVPLFGGLQLNIPGIDNKAVLVSFVMSIIPALYKPALLIAAAKIIQILEHKNAAN